MSQAVNNEAKRILEQMDPSERVIIYSMGALGRPLNKKVDIQKVIFLSSRAIPDVFDNLFHFQAHKKGPYSERIDEDVMVLSSNGLVAGADFGLSDLGFSVYEIISENIKEPLKGTIEENKEFITNMTEDELLTFVYVIYPDFQKNSEEWERLKNNRIKAAVSLLKKGKVSLSRAAEIGGMNYFDFEDYLSGEKIRWKS